MANQTSDQLKDQTTDGKSQMVGRENYNPFHHTIASMFGPCECALISIF